MRVSNFCSNNYTENKTNGDRNKTLPVKEYPNKIRPYLKGIINNLKKFDTFKIQLTTANNLISYTDNDEGHIMHSRNDYIKMKINDEADEVIKDLFDLPKNRNQNNLESVNGSEFVFDYVHLFYYICHKINPNHGGFYTDVPDWVKKQKSNNEFHQSKR